MLMLSPFARVTVDPSENGAYQSTVVPEPEACPTVAEDAMKMPFTPDHVEPDELVIVMAEP